MATTRRRRRKPPPGGVPIVRSIRVQKNYTRDLITKIVAPLAALTLTIVEDGIAADLAREIDPAFRLDQDELTFRRIREKIGPVTFATPQIVAPDGTILDDLDGYFDAQNAHTARLLSANVATQAAQSNVSRAAASVIIQDQSIRAGTKELWVRANLKLIKTIPVEHFKSVERILKKTVRTGIRIEEIERQLKLVNRQTAARARIIARDQVGKLNGQINRERQASIGVRSAFWRTVGDERVRDEHFELDGERFAIHRGIDNEFPGSPVQCRCWSQPNLEEVFQDAEQSLL